MNWLTQLFARRRLYRDLSEEIQAYLEEKVEELVADGMSREKAMQSARREFGNVGLIEETSREVWTWPSVEDFFFDIRYGLRGLRRNPIFTTRHPPGAWSARRRRAANGFEARYETDPAGRGRWNRGCSRIDPADDKPVVWCGSPRSPDIYCGRRPPFSDRFFGVLYSGSPSDTRPSDGGASLRIIHGSSARGCVAGNAEIRARFRVAGHLDTIAKPRGSPAQAKHCPNPKSAPGPSIQFCCVIFRRADKAAHGPRKGFSPPSSLA